MNIAQNSLWLVGVNKRFTTWKQLKEYTEQFKEYDNLTLKQIDEVFKALNPSHKGNKQTLDNFFFGK